MDSQHGISRRTAVAGLAAGLAVASLPAIAQTAGPPIRIGMGIALSGGLAAFGKSALLAMQLWAADVNAKGGLLGRKVELVFYDDQSNPATVPGIYAKLIDVDKVDLVVSGYASSQIVAAMPTVMQKKKVFMTLFGLAANDKFNYDRYFQMQPNGPVARTEFSKGFLNVAMSMDPKPTTIALVGGDAEFPSIALDGARENVKALGLKVVYDRTYPPNTIEFASVVRAIKSTNPDLVFVASYPPDSAGMVRAVREVGLDAKMFGGGMIGLQSAALKTQLGPMLNGVVAYDLYAPEPTMKFQGVEDFLTRYRQEAAKQGVDPLGFYIAPLAYAELQILGQAVEATKSLDDAKLAKYIHDTTFQTIAGEIRFQERGEWAEPRILLVQFQGIAGNDVAQFMEAGRQVIVYPPKFKSGTFKYPFSAASK
ncbi:amino acid ABC transporter substrate-binding protein [Xanthobacter dioxanivorans]|uniref:Amino acid ABC transporter substrate-binding protein n=1 Tax=Xanthobacter dioxanivorans TaxID=2528964 RepID=A0A974PLS3_9HYPH|nr:amino acid ABC transporter substrate-binding protein [Xanthobacter dioxanivorans]QRG05345.1 amino acid ABC transporter substrate-binding protein [Xanthobacter dioxanivorans]